MPEILGEPLHERSHLPARLLFRVIVHLNGKLVAANLASVSVFDRGFLFGDGIYEGLRAVQWGSTGTRIVGMSRHIARLQRGLDAAGIAWNAAQLRGVVADLLTANSLCDAFVYAQVTRGEPDWQRGEPVRTRIPTPGTKPTVFAYCTPLPALPSPLSPSRPATKSVKTRPDERWLRGDVKAISLLGNIMAARAAATDEAILIRETAAAGAGVARRLVTEGTYTNVLIVTERGELATPALDSAPLLPGITREILLELDSSIVSRAVEAHELDTAREIILLGTTTMVTSVNSIDGRTLEPGPVAQRLHQLLLNAISEGLDEPASERSEIMRERGPAAKCPDCCHVAGLNTRPTPAAQS